MKYPRIVDDLLVRQVRGKYGTVLGDKGYGIFARRDYKKGELIAAATGAKIKDTDPRLTHRGVQIGRHLFIEPRRFSAVWYMNHSCEPSGYIDEGKLIARRDIKKGEELTSDYSLFTDFAQWDMDCGCGMKSCRGVILPYSKLPQSTVRKEFVSSYLK